MHEQDRFSVPRNLVHMMDPDVGSSVASHNRVAGRVGEIGQAREAFVRRAQDLNWSLLCWRERAPASPSSLRSQAICAIAATSASTSPTQLRGLAAHPFKMAAIHSTASFPTQHGFVLVLGPRVWVFRPDGGAGLIAGMDSLRYCPLVPPLLAAALTLSLRRGGVSSANR